MSKSNKEIYQECLNNILAKKKLEISRAILIKGFYDKALTSLTNLLLTTWESATVIFIKDAISKITSAAGSITIKEINAVLSNLGKKLNITLADIIGEKTYSMILNIYTFSMTEILGIKPKFDIKDLDAIKWVSEDNLYWIGNYYDNQLSEKIRNAAKEGLLNMSDRTEAGKILKEILGEQFKKSDAYWEGLANHVITRSREFGRIEAYVQADVEYLKISAVIDHRTTPICRKLNGKIIPVKWGVEVRNKIMNSATPEEAKEISPWFSDAEAEALTEDVREMPHSVSLPPYHWRCRTRTVAAKETDYKKQFV